MNIRKQNKKSLLIGKHFKIDLLKASSGFQSLVLLYLVTKHLSKVTSKNDSSRYKEISLEEEKKIRKEVERIFDNNSSEDVRHIILEKLSSRLNYSCFLNIVGEPEQNLYPNSQKHILFELIRTKNEAENNQLLLTTHSPYIINYLTLAIKAKAIKVNEEGTIHKLPDYSGLPSDENYLNEHLTSSNDLFIDLLELEDEFE